MSKPKANVAHHFRFRFGYTFFFIQTHFQHLLFAHTSLAFSHTQNDNDLILGKAKATSFTQTDVVWFRNHRLLEQHRAGRAAGGFSAKISAVPLDNCIAWCVKPNKWKLNTPNGLRTQIHIYIKCKTVKMFIDSISLTTRS